MKQRMMISVLALAALYTIIAMIPMGWAWN